MSKDLINELYELFQERKNADPEISYVAHLHKKGVKKIGKKLGEEAVELVIDAMRLDEKKKNTKRRENFKEEAADVLFHYLVLLAHFDVEPKEILEILKSRQGTGGFIERASRKNK